MRLNSQLGLARSSRSFGPERRRRQTPNSTFAARIRLIHRPRGAVPCQTVFDGGSSPLSDTLRKASFLGGNPSHEAFRRSKVFQPGRHRARRSRCHLPAGPLRHADSPAPMRKSTDAARLGGEHDETGIPQDARAGWEPGVAARGLGVARLVDHPGHAARVDDEPRAGGAG